ncbi:efflux transporter periplasmic adaptor subunit [Streptococcus gallolyticus]|uniref:Efflux transporter periplasmic adaptor subunit n=1 Tax=Streptococcus gallolyticus TaxID=315405 RepID=A0A368UI49_9STRE|nr:efflux RND transporter periplasmic adaptor subunit [Streptococcus gallolyticus]RCW17886.1 efflux transporter periplasmic adaptor subunit [Streptococcus gallolyticus]
MSRRGRSKMSKKTKGIIGVAVAGFVIAGAALLWWQQTKTSESAVETTYDTAAVTEGTISSSTLLTGTVKAFQEQYVYYDSSKGTEARPTVSVGDQITTGQQLVQYDTTTAQAAYDAAVRNLNKIGRQINYLKTYGNLPTTSTTIDEETGEETTVTTPPTAQQNAEYNQQLQDLNDSYADAQAEVNKAQQALNETVIVSDVSGTVVEVNNDIDPSSKDSQTLVHVATEGQLQIKGTLTEYDLANIKTGQNVKIKSKVYPDQEWTGTISYISNYPNQSSDSTGGSGSSSSGAAAYDYKIDLTGDISNLQQGFTVSVEVVNENKNKLVPVDAVITEGDKNYVWVYDKDSQKASKVEVTLGSADAKQQEILSGLEVGQIVISNPDSSLKDGEKVSNVTSDDTATTEESEVSE